MLVRDRMTANVFTVTPETSLESALTLMRSRHIRRLPVLQQGRVVGIVTWTDLMRAQPSPATSLSRWEIPALLEKAQVRDVMSKSVETVATDAPLEEDATIMRQRQQPTDQQLKRRSTLRSTSVRTHR
jgi:acetoin utilization protein AcuB